MKILELGTWKQQIQCSTCKSVLEIEESDLQVDRTSFAPHVLYVECPRCGQYIDRTKTVPPKIAARVREVPQPES